MMMNSPRPVSSLLMIVSITWFAVSTALAQQAAVTATSSAGPQATTDPAAAGAVAAQADPAESVQDNAGMRISDRPWDYDPYDVLIWVASDDVSIDAASIDTRLRRYLRRDFDALWRIEVAAMPTSVRSAVRRDIHGLDFDAIVGADPIIAVKRNHPDAIRIRSAGDLPKFVKQILATPAGIDELRRRSDPAEPRRQAIDPLLQPVVGDGMTLKKRWADDATEAIMVSRGIAETLAKPDAKLIPVPMSDLVASQTGRYDKIMLVDIRTQDSPGVVRVVEFDTLMRYFGSVASADFVSLIDVPDAVGRAVTSAFSPIIRIDEAGSARAGGWLRAGGLITDPASPALVNVGDAMLPMLRKNDKNGKPFLIGPLDWTYLLVSERDGAKYKLDIHSGRSGGFSVRMNNRTFRTALKVNPVDNQTILRLHARGDATAPLIGYEIYERKLDSKDMTFVGRTDWDGRLTINKSAVPLHLLYVKNGGAVLAKLPVVPGLMPMEVADLSGDDLRLQAEAYIRGVQNTIVDLIAIRELFAARIKLRLKRGEIPQAKELMAQFREQPTNESLGDDMSAKQDEFLKLIGRNPSQRKKVEEMFATTRDLMTKHINGRLLSSLEADIIAAEKSGGK